MAPSYDEMRNRNLQENKKKLDELNLRLLSSSLKNSPVKQPKPKKLREGPPDPARRSLRLSNLPNSRVFKDTELAGRAYAIAEAQKLQSQLDPAFPSIIRSVSRSHATTGAVMRLPVKFAKKHLPNYDTSVSLVNEKEEEFNITYLACYCGLSAGWRNFSIYHELVYGDALVFHLIKPTTFKVYITRAYLQG